MLNNEYPTAEEWAEKQVIVKGEQIFLRLNALDPQVLPYFPDFSMSSQIPGTTTDFRNIENICGHQQRSYALYYTLRAIAEHNGIIGIDFGSAGVLAPACISSDIIGTGELCPYGDRNYDNVHLKIDAANTKILGTDTFSCVIASHVAEHLGCSTVSPSATPQERLRFGCPGYEVAKTIRENWIRILRPGGYCCMILPDEKWAKESGSSVLLMDETHRHSWSAQEFYDNVVSQLLDVVEVVEMDTLNNFFSFNMTLRKKHQ